MYYGADIPALVEGMNVVKDAGFDAVEFFVLDKNQDIRPIIKAKNELGLDIALFIPVRGSLVDPSARGAYLKVLEDAIQIAEQLDCRRLTLMSGKELKGVSREEQHISVVEGLKACATLLEPTGIMGVLEPLNQVTNCGNYLSRSDEGFRIIDEVGSPSIKLLYDVYHQQITEGNLISTITWNIEKIGHLHAAGIPDRHEINTGEINYSEIFKAVGATSYDGYFGLEYRPTKEISESLKEARKLCI